MDFEGVFRFALPPPHWLFDVSASRPDATPRCRLKEWQLKHDRLDGGCEAAPFSSGADGEEKSFANPPCISDSGGHI